MRDLVIRLAPSRFEDLVALLALYRPGPLKSGMVDDFIKRKQGKTAITYELPELEGILSETYGVIVYQEQVMKIATVLANFTPGRGRSPAAGHGQEEGRRDGDAEEELSRRGPEQ